MNQLEKIFNLTGNREQMKDISVFSRKILDTVKIDRGAGSDEAWHNAFHSITPEALDLLKKLLQLDPKERWSAHQALNHKYVSQFHMPAVERVAPHPVKVPSNAPATADPGLHGAHALHASIGRALTAGSHACLLAVEDNEKKSTNVYREHLYKHVSKQNKQQQQQQQPSSVRYGSGQGSRRASHGGESERYQ